MISMAFPQTKSSVVCEELMVTSKFHFLQQKTYLTHFTNEFLKSKETFETWAVLCKFSILFSTLKLKLRHIFSQFNIDSKLVVLNVGLRLYFLVLPIHKEIKTSQFSVFVSKDLSIFPNSQKRLKIEILDIALDYTSSPFPICQRV